MQHQSEQFLKHVPLQRALEVVRACFPEQPIGMSRDRRWLHPSESLSPRCTLILGCGCVTNTVLSWCTPARRAALVHKLHELAGVPHAVEQDKPAKSLLSAITGGKGGGLSQVVMMARPLKFSAFMDACLKSWRQQSASDTVRATAQRVQAVELMT